MEMATSHPISVKKLDTSLTIRKKHVHLAA
jgi:hypothetical protein